MKILLAMSLIFLSVGLAAEDGLVMQFTIDEKTLDESHRSQYINAILVSYPGTSVSEFPGQYEVKVQVDSPDNNMIDFVFTLKDISTGRPYYVGATPVSVKIGEAHAVRFERDDRVYDVAIDTSYGVLP